MGRVYSTMASPSLTNVLRETLALFDDSGAPQTTTEVAERLDLGRRSTYERLERLVEHDRLETKKVGASGRVWWRATTRTTGQSPRVRRGGRQDDQRVFELLVDAVEEYAIFLLDPEGYVRTWNRGAERIEGYDTDEILGEHLSTFYTEDDCAADVPEQNLSKAANYGSIEDEGWRVRADGSRFWADVIIRPIYDDDSLTGYAKITRDMTERRERERQLRTFRKAVEASGHSIYFTDSDGTIEYVNPAFEETTGYTAEEAIGQTPRLLKSGEHDQDFYGELWNTVLAGNIWRNELINTTKEGGRYVVDQTIAPVEGESDEIEHFVAVNANITARVQAERELRRHRDQLAALNDINDIVYEITEAVIEQSTRDEIERTVCEALADTDAYDFAWIGDTDRNQQNVIVRTKAGVQGTLDEMKIPVDSDDEHSTGPTGSAYRTGTIHVKNGIETESRHELSGDDVDVDSVRSVAAIPLIHDDTVHGVLNVYANRQDVFESHEQAMLGQFGEIVGQAITAAERKEALTSDKVIELEFHVPDVFESMGVDASADSRFVLDDVVATSDEAYLVYGTMTPNARETLDALTDQHAHWDSITVIGEEEDSIRFQARVTELPLRSVVASEGGSIEEVLFEDGALHLRIHLPSSGDMSAITETVEGTYPTARLLSKRQIPRPQDPMIDIRKSLSEELTDRQQAALEAAYHQGYFEWPRDTNGQEMADSLGIAPPTFSQHLRRAEKAVVESVFSFSTPA